MDEKILDSFKQNTIELDGQTNWIIEKSTVNTQLVTSLLDNLFKKQEVTMIWKEYTNDILLHFVWESMLNIGEVDWELIPGLIVYKKHLVIPEWYEDIQATDSIIEVWNKIVYEILQYEYPQLDETLLLNVNQIELFKNLYFHLLILEILMPKYLKKSKYELAKIIQDSSKEEYEKFLITSTNEMNEEHLGIIWNFSIEQLKRNISWNDLNNFLENQNWEFTVDFIQKKL